MNFNDYLGRGSPFVNIRTMQHTINTITVSASYIQTQTELILELQIYWYNSLIIQIVFEGQDI